MGTKKDKKATSKRKGASIVAEGTVPYFKTDQEAAAFWDQHEYTEFPGLVEKLERLLKAREQENKKLITLKVEPSLLAAIKVVAETKGLGYSALIRMWLLERLHAERSRSMRH